VELGFAGALEPLGLADGPEGALEPFLREPGGSIVRGELQDKRRLELRVPSTGLRVTIALDAAATWWWFPLETLTHEGGPITLREQGTIFLPFWEISLWGEETREILLSLEVTEAREEPIAIIEDDD